MNDTPTDIKKIRMECGTCHGYWVSPENAQKLMDQLTAVTAENAALRETKARLLRQLISRLDNAYARYEQNLQLHGDAVSNASRRADYLTLKDVVMLIKAIDAAKGGSHE